MSGSRRGSLKQKSERFDGNINKRGSVKLCTRRHPPLPPKHACTIPLYYHRSSFPLHGSIALFCTQRHKRASAVLPDPFHLRCFLLVCTFHGSRFSFALMYPPMYCFPLLCSLQEGEAVHCRPRCFGLLLVCRCGLVPPSGVCVGECLRVQAWMC